MKLVLQRYETVWEASGEASDFCSEMAVYGASMLMNGWGYTKEMERLYQ